MIRDINKHAAVVLDGVPTPGLAPDGGRSAPTSSAAGEAASGLVLDDLRKPWVAGFSELRIQDPKRCYDGTPAAAGAASAAVGTGQRRTAADALKAAEALRAAGLGNPPMSSHAAEAALTDVAARSGRAGAGWDDALRAASGPPQANLSPQMQAVLREACLTVNELLRHFWAAFPLSSATREARALRLKKALADQYDRTTAMQVQPSHYSFTHCWTTGARGMRLSVGPRDARKISECCLLIKRLQGLVGLVRKTWVSNLALQHVTQHVLLCAYRNRPRGLSACTSHSS